MKLLIGFILLTLSHLSFAQINTHSGGGPDEIPPEVLKKLICTTLDDQVTANEKKFVESYHLKYSSYEDFTELLQKLDLKNTLNDLKSLGNDTLCPKCKEDNIVLIRSIQKNYLEGAKACKEFSDRIKNLDLLNKVIESYDKR